MRALRPALRIKASGARGRRSWGGSRGPARRSPRTRPPRRPGRREGSPCAGRAGAGDAIRLRTAPPVAATRRPRPARRRPRARRCTASSRSESSGALPAQNSSGLERCDLLAEVGEIRLGVERPAHDALKQLRRSERTTPAVDVLPQPLAERAELAALELRVEIPQLARRALPQLNGDHVPECVG